MTAQQLQSKPQLSKPENDHERFLYAVSHDLQEPLRMVTSFLKLLEQKIGDQLDADARNYLDFTTENADRMKLMIHALVDLSRVGRDCEPEASIKLEEVFDDLSQMYAEELTATKGNMTFKVEHSVKASHGLLVKLIQILIENSLENASKERALYIEVNSKMVADNMIELSFSDNGVGIKSSYQSRVFDVFQRVGHKPGKIGAGLAIAKAIVEKFGGEISLESTEGCGTTVSIRLPAGA